MHGLEVGAGAGGVTQRRDLVSYEEVVGEATYAKAGGVDAEIGEEANGAAGGGKVGQGETSVAALAAFEPSVAPSVGPFEEASPTASDWDVP